MNRALPIQQSIERIERVELRLRGRAFRPVAALRRFVATATAHDVTGMAAEMSYNFMLALIPLLVFFASLAGLISRAIGGPNAFLTIMSAVETYLPADASQMLSGLIQDVVEERANTLVPLGFLGALLGSSNGTLSAMKALNRVYGVAETRSWWKTKLIAVALTAVFAAAVSLSVVVIVFGASIGGFVARLLGIGSYFDMVFAFGRWPALLAAFAGALAVLYRLAPASRLPVRHVWVGATCAATAWVVAMAILLSMMDFIISYSATFGTLGGAFVLLVWFQFTGLVTLLGAELNVQLAKRQTGVDLPPNAGL